MRRVLAVSLVLGLIAVAALAVAQQATITTQYNGSNLNWFIRSVACNVPTVDTLAGPSVWCFGAKQVIWVIRDNQGPCSLSTIHVSMNDTLWEIGTQNSVVIFNDLTSLDSLNAGGRSISLLPTETGAGAPLNRIPWNYCRAVLTPRLDSAADAGAALCNSGMDSVRFIAHVVWN